MLKNRFDAKENIFFEEISYYRADLMGIAISWVMFLHGSEMFPDIHIPIITQLANRGNLGVDIFLFLSGFGLWFSMNHNEDIKCFYKNRIIRVVVPYLLLSLPFWIIISTIDHSSSFDFIMNYLGISFWTKGVTLMWYIPYIVLLYALYPIIHLIEKKWGGLSYVWLIGVSISLVFFLSLVFRIIYDNVEIAITRTHGFLLGSLAARAYNNKKSDSILFIALTCTFFISFILCAVFYPKNAELGKMLYRFGGIGICVILIVFLCILFTKIRYGKKSLLSRLGKYTLDIYAASVFTRYFFEFRSRHRSFTSRANPYMELNYGNEYCRRHFVS